MENFEDFMLAIKEKYKDRRICVAWPSPELTDYRFNHSLIELITQNSSVFQIALGNAISSRIAINRNSCVEKAREVKATDILWLDSDCKFPVNGLMRLLQHDKDIVCATTRRRNSEGYPVGIPVTPDIQGTLMEMKMIGFPFMLTKMSVFDKLEKPYFAEPPRKLVPEMDCMPDELVGEDEYFCHSARKAGFQIWCDMELSLEIGHVTSEVKYIDNEFVRITPGAVDLKI